MGLLLELEDYRQPNGLYSNQKNPADDSSGNCIAITSLAMWLAHSLEEFRQTQNITRLQEFEEEISNCEVFGFPGLLNRSPTKKNDQEGWDDYILLLLASRKDCLNMLICGQILNISQHYFCTFNNVQPGKVAWQAFFARHLSFLGHLSFSNNQRPGILYSCLWFLGVMSSCFSYDPTDILLSFAVIETMSGKSFLCTVAASIWSFSMRNKDLQSMVGLWLSVEKDSSGNPVPNMEHPIVKYWRHNV